MAVASDGRWQLVATIGDGQWQTVQFAAADGGDNWQ